MSPQKILMHIGAALSLAAAVGNTGAVDFDPANPIPDPIVKSSVAQPGITIELETIAMGLNAPNLLTHAGDGTDRLFVVQQLGQIGLIDGGVLSPTPFLDLSGVLVDPRPGFDERGLLGLAFHPDFSTNGKLYTFTSEPISAPADFGQPPVDPLTHQTVISEWMVDPTDANKVLVDPDPAKLSESRREILRIDNPQFNHNGGSIDFGPDGKLYVAIGDGGSSNDNAPGHGPEIAPGIFEGNGQNPSNVLGTILRIDVDGSDSANGQYGIPGDNPFTLNNDIPDEIFAYGFRNPFRASFDSETGEYIVADVGQGAIEEIDIVTAGGNFGWRAKEGSFAFVLDEFGEDSVSDDLSGVPLGLIDPVLEYDHTEGLSVIGGFVYYGTAIPELYGKYVFGDFSTGFGFGAGRLFYGDLDTGLIQEFIIGLDDRALGLFIKGFGIDASGEIYVLGDTGLGPDSLGGVALKLVAAPVPVPAAVWLFGSALGALVVRRRKTAFRQA